MLPGKSYKPEDLLMILRKRYWVLLVPFAIVGAATAIVGRKLPDVYKSEALLVVVPPRVPETFVKSTVSSNMADRLQSIQAQILSRTNLEQIVEEFNLYPQERQTQIMEDVIEQMRADIKIAVKNGDAFTVAYYGRNARTVMKVTERLAGLFIDENLKDRQALAEGTDQFLESSLEDAKRRLIEQEKKLEAYKTRYSGELPSQVQANLQAVQTALLQVKSIDESISADRQRRLLVEKSLKDLESTDTTTLSDAPPANTASGVGVPDGPPGTTTAQTLDAAKRQLRLLKQRYSDDWPDVKAQQKYVDELKTKVDAEALERPVSPTADPAATGRTQAERTRERRMQGLKDELQQIDQQIAAKEAESKRLRGVASSYQARVETVPARESEMTELMRDYSTLTSLYTGLLSKREDAKISANLERRQIGEQFKLLDAARLPEKPYSPDRIQINIRGMGAGFVLGLLLIVLFEYRDMSFKTDEEVTRLLSLPVLAVVPMMQSDQDRFRARRRRIVLDVGLGSTVACCLAILAYTFVR